MNDLERYMVEEAIPFCHKESPLITNRATDKDKVNRALEVLGIDPEHVRWISSLQEPLGSLWLHHGWWSSSTSEYRATKSFLSYDSVHNDNMNNAAAWYGGEQVAIRGTSWQLFGTSQSSRGFVVYNPSLGGGSFDFMSNAYVMMCANHHPEPGCRVKARAILDINLETSALYGRGRANMSVGKEETMSLTTPRLMLVERPFQVTRIPRMGVIHHDPPRPAIRWPDGKSTYVWRGDVVDRADIVYFLEPKQISPALILALDDGARQNRLAEWTGGWLEVLSRVRDSPRPYSGAMARWVGSDGLGELWAIYDPQRWSSLALPSLPSVLSEGTTSYIALVVVENSTALEDGTHERVALRVSPRTRTPTEAVASTFGLQAERYSPFAES